MADHIDIKRTFDAFRTAALDANPKNDVSGCEEDASPPCVELVRTIKFRNCDSFQTANAFIRDLSSVLPDLRWCPMHEEWISGDAFLGGVTLVQLRRENGEVEVSMQYHRFLDGPDQLLGPLELAAVAGERSRFFDRACAALSLSARGVSAETTVSYLGPI